MSSHEGKCVYYTPRFTLMDTCRFSQRTIANYLSRSSVFRSLGQKRWIWTGEYKKELKPRGVKKVAALAASLTAAPKCPPQFTLSLPYDSQAAVEDRPIGNPFVSMAQSSSHKTGSGPTQRQVNDFQALGATSLVLIPAKHQSTMAVSSTFARLRQSGW